MRFNIQNLLTCFNEFLEYCMYKPDISLQTTLTTMKTPLFRNKYFCELLQTPKAKGSIIIDIPVLILKKVWQMLTSLY